jgi:hypothetical protein
MRFRGKRSGSGRSAGLRRSNNATVIFSAAAICADCRGLRGFLLKIGKLQLELDQQCSALRGDCWNCSCRSFLIMSLSFSISNVRAWASVSAAKRPA